MSKYPDITVELVGQDGNAFVILGQVQRALKRGKVPENEIAKWREDATSGDYDHLLQVCMEWVEVI